MSYALHINTDAYFDMMLQRQEQASYYMDEVDAVIAELDLPPDIDYWDARDAGEEELRRRQWAARCDYGDYRADGLL